MTAFRLVVSGRVQGVGYRAWFEEAAASAGLHGWVRNRKDGTVEALIAGDSALCLAMIRAAHTGPLAADVAEVTYTPAQGITAQTFSIKPTV